MMSSDVWIGAIISVPVSLASALAVPRIQGWIDRRGQSSHAKKHSRMQEEYENVLYYALHTDMLIGRLVVTAIFLLLLIMFYLIAQSVIPALGDTIAALLRPWISGVSASHGAIIAILVGSMSCVLAMSTTMVVAITRYASKFIKLFFNVKNFSCYIESIPKDIRDLTLEKITLCAKRDRALPGLGSLRSEFRKPREGEQVDNGLGPNATTSEPS